MAAPLRLDAAHSRIEIRTFAKGAFSRLAHDLSLLAAAVEGTSTPNEGSPADGGIADLRVRVAGIVVNGILEGASVDTNRPNVSDRRDIEKRIRDDVFAGASTLEIRVEARHGRASARVHWVGGSAAISSPATLEQRSDGTWRCTGRATLSLSALGVKPVYGPLRAFRIADEVEIIWDVVFTPQSA